MTSHKKSSMAALTMGAIGVVYGDIGTSPLYAFKQVFVAGHVQVTPENILGILSLFFWTLTAIVSIKYVGLIMRADNEGEGGLMALLAMASNSVRDNPALRRTLMTLGVFGVALFFGDGVITPAISVLSAVEGLETVTTAAKPYVIPISVGVLLALFIGQKFGTDKLGRFFGPVMLIWFFAIGVAGVVPIIQTPVVLRAVLPQYAVYFFLEHYQLAFITLGAVFLCVTGAEALYADMGHFGKQPIRIAWFLLVMPSLILNYFGQGALVLAAPDSIESPFFLMFPNWATAPMVGLATIATVIASQALISGAFSATKQTIQLGYLPRLAIHHTSANAVGQIYVPAVNWALLGGVLAAVLIFRSSDALAAAYGISVSLVMVITTMLTYFVIRYGWKLPLPLCIASTALFFIIDVSFFVSNSLKIVEGGWFPLTMAALLYFLLKTWKDGRRLLSAKLRSESMDLHTFLSSLVASPPTLVDGTAVFLTANLGITPSALLHNLKHNKVFHKHNIFLTVENLEVPRAPLKKRIEVTYLNEGCWQVIARFGFMEQPDIPKALHLTHFDDWKVNAMTTSYFLSRDIIVPTVGGKMSPWREKIFAQMHRSAGEAADFLKIPSNAVIELGSKVEI